ncbi:hypothetical protein OPQ81_000180 [Rhizoctonia solani]|nr:hypothetical protein OPQ81_000180 [Rhizoctonia solani]
MTISEYLSKRISWDPPLRLPRLSIPSIFHLQLSRSGAPKPPIADDTSTNITTISYPKSPATDRHPRLHTYIRRISKPFVRSFKLRAEGIVSDPTKPRLDTLDMPTMHSRFQLPPSPSFPATSPSSPIFAVPESPEVSQLQTDRAIRAEQDAAYERAQKLDQERLKKLREERILEEERLKRVAELEEQERIREREQAAYKRAQNEWRRWARRTRIPATQAGNGVQFAVRLPCGQRYLGNLPPDASLEVLHVLVETLLIPPSFRPEDDPEDPPEGYKHRWGFGLVTTNSRFVVPNDSSSNIRGLEVMKKGVLLIVEEFEGMEDNKIE